jgi:flavorubredoxin
MQSPKAPTIKHDRWKTYAKGEAAMKARKIKDRIYWMGAVDWDSRLFDSLIPLPDGTSYNVYLIEGSEKTALLDSVQSRITLAQSRRFSKNTQAPS